MQFKSYFVFFTNVKDTCVIGGKGQVIVVSIINNLRIGLSGRHLLMTSIIGSITTLMRLDCGFSTAL